VDSAEKADYPPHTMWRDLGITEQDWEQAPPKMQKRMTRKSILTYTVIAWVIGCGFYAYYYVSSILSLPDLSQGYEQDWSFQLLMFFIFRFPLLLIVLIMITVVEVVATKNTKTM
jgi:H+/Cl- antiporter ClcA